MPELLTHCMICLGDICILAFTNHFLKIESRYMKPLFTQRGGEFSVENLPACCSPLASCITGKHRRFENEDVYERRSANVRLVRECYN